jgi:energy-coupling factor transport system ATP-binding protein
MNTVYQYASRVLVMKNGELQFDGTPLDLYTKQDLEAWNLDLPEILELTKQLEIKLNVTFSRLPRTIDELYEQVKEVLS